MSGRRLLTLLIILLVLGGLAALTQRGGQRPVTAGGVALGEPLFQDLDLNAIESIVMADQGATNELARREGRWLVDALYDYPCDFERLRGALTSLSGLTVGQVIRGGEDLLDELGLSTNATEVTLKDGAAETLAVFRIGDSRQSQRGGGMGGFPDGRYLRVGEGPVVLVDESLMRWTTDPAEWIDKELLRVPAEDVSRVEVGYAEGTSLTVHYPADGSPVIRELAGDESVNAGNAGRLKRALANLNAITVAPPSLDDDDMGLDQAVTTTVFTRRGLIYTAQIGDEGEEGTYVRLSVAYQAPSAPTREEAEALTPVDAEEAAESAPGDAGSEDPAPSRKERVDQKLEELTAEHEAKVAETLEQLEKLRFLENWTYVISSYYADSLSLPRSELIDVAEATEAETPGDATPAAVTTDPASFSDAAAAEEPAASAPPEEAGATAPDEAEPAPPAADGPDAAPSAPESAGPENLPAAPDAGEPADVPPPPPLGSEVGPELDSAAATATQSLRQTVSEGAAAAAALSEETAAAAREAIRQTGDAAETAIAELKQTVEEARDSVREAADRVQQSAGDSAKKAQDAAIAAAAQASAAIQEAVEQTRSAAEQNAEGIRKAVDQAKEDFASKAGQVKEAAEAAAREAEQTARTLIEESRKATTADPKAVPEGGESHAVPAAQDDSSRPVPPVDPDGATAPTTMGAEEAADAGSTAGPEAIAPASADPVDSAPAGSDSNAEPPASDASAPASEAPPHRRLESYPIRS